MTRWRVSAFTVLMVVLAVAAVPVTGQQARGTSINAAASASAGSWTPPRTPWGDPDLQGTWTTDSANGIPLQRPVELGTRAELNDEEFAQKLARDERTRTAAENAVGSFRGDGAWLTTSLRQTSLIVEPADGRLPPYAPGAELRTSPQGTYGEGPLDGPEDFTLYDRCLTLGVVGSMTPKIYGNGHRIVQGPGYVAIMNEMIHEARIIPLDGRPHVGNDIRLYMGDGRGRWEGDTLVVETTNLTDKTNAPGGRIRHTKEMTVIERFTRTADDMLRYEAVLDDPKTFTKPVKISIPLTSPPGYMVLPYDCHEGNLAVLQSLGGERAEDRAVEEDRKKGIIRPRKIIQGLTVPGGPLGSPGPVSGATAPPSTQGTTTPQPAR
jgi:hypothetical protein